MAVKIVNPLTIVKQGGGVSRPATWADFKAMTLTQMQAVYGVGDRVGLACPVSGVASNDLLWEIADFGTTKLSGDETEYSCVTLVARLLPAQTIAFDARETPTAATEETAQAGIYYFGFDGSTYTALGLNEGDTIPYGDYTAVYKTDVTDNATYYDQIRQSGYNNYHFSAARQWLNSEGAAGAWWNASHVGDAAPSQATSVAGFMSMLPADFKAILSRTEVKSVGNTVTDGGATYTDYDYFFLPSRYEMYAVNTPVEGDRMSYFAINASAKNSLRIRGGMSGGGSSEWRTRSCRQADANSVHDVASGGAATTSRFALEALSLLPACKIVLAS